MDVTASFLAGSILGLVLPLALLIESWCGGCSSCAVAATETRSYRVWRSTTEGRPWRTILSTSHMRAVSCPGTRHAKR